MNAEIVQPAVDGLSLRISKATFREFPRPTVRRREGEMPAGLGFYVTENIGRPATLMFVIPPRFPLRGWPHIGVPGDRLLVLNRSPVVGHRKPLRHVFRLGDPVVIEIGHHPDFFPPLLPIVARQEHPEDGFPSCARNQFCV